MDSLDNGVMRIPKRRVVNLSFFFDIIFPKILDAICENFSDSSLHHIFESENFRFAFLYEKYPNLGSKMWKLIFRKS